VNRVLGAVVLAVTLGLAWAASQSGPDAALAADRDCADFSTQRQAQRFFERHGGPRRDPHNLDGDGDGRACEDLPCPCGSGGGGGDGGGSGGGGRDGGRDRTQRARVVSVTDGDTIRVRVNGHKRDLRLIGIDTPEVYGGRECGGGRASKSMKRMLDSGSRVKLIKDFSQDRRDRYGRLLRYVKRGGRDVGKRQIRRGWARVYVYERPFRKVGSYRRAQHRAKARNRGVWKHCDGHFHSGG
jgi:endonuclease YncB( thermonuclease family)